jgi:hypothetical protein
MGANPESITPDVDVFAVLRFIDIIVVMDSGFVRFLERPGMTELRELHEL